MDKVDKIAAAAKKQYDDCVKKREKLEQGQGLA